MRFRSPPDVPLPEDEPCSQDAALRDSSTGLRHQLDVALEASRLYRVEWDEAQAALRKIVKDFEAVEAQREAEGDPRDYVSERLAGYAYDALEREREVSADARSRGVTTPDTGKQS